MKVPEKLLKNQCKLQFKNAELAARCANTIRKEAEHGRLYQSAKSRAAPLDQISNHKLVLNQK